LNQELFGWVKTINSQKYLSFKIKIHDTPSKK
jgi:hypothetical protein